MTKQDCLFCASGFLIITALVVGISYLLMQDFFSWAKISAGLTVVFLLLYTYRVVQENWIKKRR